MFFFADPVKDTPLDTSIKNFVNVEFPLEDLPLFMLVNVVEEKIDWFEPMPEISTDRLADFVGTLAFFDLFEAVKNTDLDNDMLGSMEAISEAYVRGAPPTSKESAAKKSSQFSAKNEEL